MLKIKYLLCFIFIFPATALADLWQTPDQQGLKLLQQGKAQEAADIFKDKNWQSVAYYRAGKYEQAYKQFSENKTSDGQYNAGNAAAYLGKYQEAIAAYDKAIALNANNADAVTNREIVKKLLEKKQQENKSCPNKNKDNSDQKNDKQKQQEDEKKPEKNSDQPDKDQKKDDKQQRKADETKAFTKQQRQKENDDQILRRLADDPGGLLQQKFLRDYAQRHGVQD